MAEPAVPGVKMAVLIGKLDHFAKHAGCSRALNEVCREAAEALRGFAPILAEKEREIAAAIESHDAWAKSWHAKLEAAEAALAGERERADCEKADAEKWFREYMDLARKHASDRASAAIAHLEIEMTRHRDTAAEAVDWRAMVALLEPFADEKNGAMQDLLWGDQPDSATMTITCQLGHVRKAREAVRAAAIRAQGE